VFVAIAIAGTLWVMFHMNTNMMPSHTDMPAMEQAAPAAAPKAGL
jgi:cytochrome o ubiquinol oxidase operon protein cyoD